MKKITHMMLAVLRISLSHGYPEYYNLSSTKQVFQTLPLGGDIGLTAPYRDPFQTIRPKGASVDNLIMELDTFNTKYSNPFIYATRVPLVFETRMPAIFDSLQYSDSSSSESSLMSSWISSYSGTRSADNWFSSLWKGTDALANTALKYTSNWLRDTLNNLETFEGYKSRMSRALTAFKDMAGEFLNKLSDKGTEWTNLIYTRLADSNRSNTELLEKIKLLEEEVATLKSRQQISADNYPEPTYADSSYFDPEPRLFDERQDNDEFDLELDQTREIRRQIDLDRTQRVRRRS